MRSEEKSKVFPLGSERSWAQHRVISCQSYSTRVTQEQLEAQQHSSLLMGYPLPQGNNVTNFFPVFLFQFCFFPPSVFIFVFFSAFKVTSQVKSVSLMNCPVRHHFSVSIIVFKCVKFIYVAEIKL